MLGELLINTNFNERSLIIKCLVAKTRKDSETYFGDYLKTVKFDNEKTNKRKTSIKDYVEKHFFNNKSILEVKNDFQKAIAEIVGEEDLKEIGDILPPILMDSMSINSLKPAANIDLTLGNEVYVTTDKVPMKLDSTGKEDVVSIEPGEFGILMTHEYLFIPWDLLGFISIRLTHKQKGLVNISGFHVDPGYFGRLMFAVFNAGPNSVPLRYDDSVFMIMFSKLTEITEIKKGRWHGMENIPVETLSGLTGTSVSVRSLDERIKRLELIFPALAAGIASIVVAIITWIITHW
jgi:dCTP deaminase